MASRSSRKSAMVSSCGAAIAGGSCGYKRGAATLAVVDRQFRVLAVIEYQGAGHYGRRWRDARRARKSDRLKRAALRSAGIPLIEVAAKYQAATVKAAVIGCLPRV